MLKTEIEFTEVNVSEPPPRLRRRHAKTRTGCNGCKRRRIKCDERTPSCGSCVRNGVICVRDQPPGLNPKTRLQVTSKDDSSFGTSRFQRENNQPVANASPGPDIDLLQMRLFFHFTNHTSSTLVFGPVVWNACIGLALQNKFLMHAIFMIAAAHMSYESPTSEELKTAELEHLAAASAGLRQNLALRSDAPNLETVANLETVFPVCILLMYQTWASFEQNNDANHDIMPSIDADFLVHLGAGFRHFITDTPTRNDLFSSRIFQKASRYSPRVELVQFLEDSQGSGLPSEFEDEFCMEYRRIWPDNSAENAACLPTYMAECRRLTLLLSALELERREFDISSLEEAIARYVFTWPMLLSPDFMTLMQSHAPCVPLLFWHFYTTVQASIAGKYWWAQRRTDSMVKSLRRRLQEDGIQPKRMLLRNR